MSTSRIKYTGHWCQMIYSQLSLRTQENVKKECGWEYVGLKVYSGYHYLDITLL